MLCAQRLKTLPKDDKNLISSYNPSLLCLGDCLLQPWHLSLSSEPCNSCLDFSTTPVKLELSNQEKRNHLHEEVILERSDKLLVHPDA